MTSKIDKHTDFYQIKDNFIRTKSVKSNLIYGDESILAEVKVTVTIPTYKRVSALEDAVSSAILQTHYDEYCIVVIDNDPTRDCETEKYIKSLDNNIILYYKNEENIGMFGNHNRCFELPKSKWIVLLHDDDLILPSFLNESMEIVDKNPSIDGLQPAKQRWYESTEQLNAIQLKKRMRYSLKRIHDISMYRYFALGAPTCGLFKKETVLACGGYNPDYYPTSDYCFATIFSYKYKIYRYNKVLALYRVGINESTKPEVLSLFIYNDYYLRRKICQRYKFSKIGTNIILNYTAKKQERSLQKRYNPDFTFDFSKLNIKRTAPAPIYLLVKAMYRLKAYLIILFCKK